MIRALCWLFGHRIWSLYRREQGSDAHREAVFEAVRVLAEGKKP